MILQPFFILWILLPGFVSYLTPGRIRKKLIVGILTVLTQVTLLVLLGMFLGRNDPYAGEAFGVLIWVIGLEMFLSLIAIIAGSLSSRRK